MANSLISKPIISSDSHIMEPPDTYTARIDKKYLGSAPKVVWMEKGGDTYVIEGMTQTIPMGLIAAAGKTAEELGTSATFAKFEDLH
ncbi:MAG: amidohydrolase family protein, partial [Candidatus Binataceae bacterium]